MAGMDTDSINPLTLSLDEVIKLNRFRNQEAQQQASASASAAINIKHNGCVNGHSDEELTSTIQDKLRDNPTNENRSIFDRLGWKKQNHNSYRGKTMVQHQALRAIRSAQQFKSRSNVKMVRNFSPGMPPPLTANVLRRHNKILGNFTVRRKTHPGSVYSMSTQSVRPTNYRHSLKKSLDPEIHQLIQNMINDRQPAVVQSSRGRTIIDHSLLSRYRVRCDCTSIPTCDRFLMND